MATDHLAEKMRQTRTARGLTQGDLASEFGVKQTRISEWERGVRDVDDEYRDRVAAWCGGDDANEEGKASDGDKKEAVAPPVATVPATPKANAPSLAEKKSVRAGVYALRLVHDSPMQVISVPIATKIDPRSGRERSYSVTFLRPRAVNLTELRCSNKECGNTWYHEPILRPASMRAHEEEFHHFDRYRKSHSCPKCGSPGRDNVVNRGTGPRRLGVDAMAWLSVEERNRMERELDPTRTRQPAYTSIKDVNGNEKTIQQGWSELPMTWRASRQDAPQPVRKFVEIVFIGSDVDMVMAGLIPSERYQDATTTWSSIEALDQEMDELSETIASEGSTEAEKADAAKRFRELREQRAILLKGTAA